MKNYFNLIPWWVWSTALIMASFVPGLYLIVAEIWYLSVFLQTKTQAPEHYTACKVRYFTATALVLILQSLDYLISYLYANGTLPLQANVFSISRTILLFALMLLMVWQIVILLNAYSYATAGDKFKNSRAKYLLIFIFAPIGAWYISKNEQKEL